MHHPRPQTPNTRICNPPLVLLFLGLACLAACSSAPENRALEEGFSRQDRPIVDNPLYAQPDGRYGYSQTNPICVASIAGQRPRSSHIYFSRLRGPHGESVEYKRLGSCCRFPTPNGLFEDAGLLDTYQVTYPGIAEPAQLFLNFYDPGPIRAPEGFRLE